VYLERLRRRIAELAAAGLRRDVRSEAPADVRDFSSNDYLGLRAQRDVVAALRRANVAGSSGARLLSGAAAEHARLETVLSAYTRREATLLFSSGYLAAAGTVAALAPHFACVYSDEKNHASLIDGVRLSKSERIVYRHLDVTAIARERRSKLIVTESRFGMDGDCADIAALVAALGPDDALLVDEAHALGVEGARGAGLCAEFADERVLVLGTLSKSFGVLGGFVAGPRDAVAYLMNAARTFVFDTALPPALAEAAIVAVHLAARADEARARLLEHARVARQRIASAGFDVAGASAHIVPVLTRDVETTLAVQRALLERRVLVAAIRPPTVAAGSSRLRISLTAGHGDADVDALVEGLRACGPCAAIS